MRLLPPAHHIDDSGRASQPGDDEWRIESYENGVLRLTNVRTAAVGLLADDSVHSYRRDAGRGEEHGYLVLLAQCVVRGELVQFTPVTRPGESLPVTPITLLAEAYLQTSLECHAWKNAFLELQGWEVPDPVPGESSDVWDVIESHCIPTYAQDTYQRYHSLFLAELVGVRTRLDRVMQLFHHVLPHDYQAEIVRGTRQLDIELWSYLQLPGLLKQVSGVDADAMFRGRFVGVVSVLRRVSRDADRRRDELTAA